MQLYKINAATEFPSAHARGINYVQPSVEDNRDRRFASAEEVGSFFYSEIIRNGTPELSGVEEEIIILSQNGKPILHDEFQVFLQDLLRALPNGQATPGRTLSGDVLPVLKGTFNQGHIKLETNTAVVEYAHAPRDNVWALCRQSNDFLEILERVATKHGLILLGSGVVPSVPWEDFKKYAIPSEDFAYSWNHVQTNTRPEYCRTVFGTMGIHHNMGFSDPELMARYTTTVLRLLPTMMAIVGNSPIWDFQHSHDEQGQPLLSHRGHIQLKYGAVFGMDGLEYLYPDFLLDKDATFESIVRGLLNMPLDRTMANGEKIYCGKLTMAQYLQNGIIYNEERVFPNIDTLTMMLREPISDIRLSMTGSAPRVEARAHDGVSQPVSIALDAFYRGVLANLDEAQNLMSGLEKNEVRKQRIQVCRKGLASPVTHRDTTIKTQRDLALQLLGCAEDGLIQRGQCEEVFLNPLFALAETGVNPAQRMLMAWKNGDRRAFFDAIAYNKKSFADGATFQWPMHGFIGNRATKALVPRTMYG